MPSPPEYGTGLGLPQLQINVDQLRHTIRHEIRRTLNEIAPGVEPGMILDILVDVTAERATQIHVDVNMAAIHSVTMLPATTRDLSFTRVARAPEPTWSANSPVQNQAEFAQEYDALLTVGVDPAHGRDRTSFHTRPRYIEPSYVMNPAQRVEMPLFELAANPTINLNEVRERRFNLIDRNNDYADARRMGIEAGHRLANLKPHPFIAAVLRKKLPAPHQRCIKTTPSTVPIHPRLTVWERMKQNYALFE